MEELQHLLFIVTVGCISVHPNHSWWYLVEPGNLLCGVFLALQELQLLKGNREWLVVEAASEDSDLVCVSRTHVLLCPSLRRLLHLLKGEWFLGSQDTAQHAAVLKERGTEVLYRLRNLEVLKLNLRWVFSTERLNLQHALGRYWGRCAPIFVELLACLLVHGELHLRGGNPVHLALVWCDECVARSVEESVADNHLPELVSSHVLVRLYRK